MPDAVPSPLREQIAPIRRAIAEAMDAEHDRYTADPSQPLDYPHAVAVAVLPLVEAAVDAAAKAQLVESQLWISERAEAIREAERLRLHTQLRDLDIITSDYDGADGYLASDIDRLLSSARNTVGPASLHSPALWATSDQEATQCATLPPCAPTSRWNGESDSGHASTSEGGTTAGSGRPHG